MADMQTIYDLLKEMRGDQKEHGRQLSEHGKELATQSTCLNNLEEDVREVKKDLKKNTRDVATHIHRSDLLEAVHKDNQTRIEELEKESKKKDNRLQKLEIREKAKAWIKEKLKWILTIAGLAVGLVSKIMGLW